MSHPYLPHTPEERRKMLAVLGLRDQEELLAPIPPALRLARPPALPEALSEAELIRGFHALARMNVNLVEHPCFLGAGAYQHHIPAVVDHLAGRAEFYTAYTPYQPEMSQGMLQAIFEFQTMIAELCGLPVANASLYDGATAAAEAALMAIGATGRTKILVARTLHPEYRDVIRTYLRFREVEPIELPVGAGRLRADALPLDTGVAALIVGYPNFFGQIEDLGALAEAVHAVGASLIVAANPVALGLLEAPGRLGADLVIGEGQPLGSPPNFGGPGLGFMACRDGFLRRMPGRLVGRTVDGKGRHGYVLTLQTREQHIRRERATSNICSNAALLALRATIYLAAVGPDGLHEVAAQCAGAARHALHRLTRCKGFVPLFDGPFFHEFALRSPVPVGELNAALREHGIIGGLDLAPYYPEFGQAVLLAVTEVRSAAEIEELAQVMEAIAC
ncbi:MAG: aminomethyl-transferring glycine dehydrogenase subunit GcvPA [Bacteroidota bacterium]